MSMSILTIINACEQIELINSNYRSKKPYNIKGFSFLNRCYDL